VPENEVVYTITWYDRTDERLPKDPVCDYCSSPLEVFPVPVLTDRDGLDPHALCEVCTNRSFIKEGDDEYFETLEYQIDLKKAGEQGVDFGGRKRTRRESP
jgi:hypothetical protein